MVMFCDISASTVPFRDLQTELDRLGQEIGMQISAVHEDIFNAMHSV
jgi:ACT domain-containing protein